MKRKLVRALALFLALLSLLNAPVLAAGPGLPRGSEEMKLSVSQSVFDLQKNNFNFSYRGEKDIKGKGNMALYFVEKK